MMHGLTNLKIHFNIMIVFLSVACKMNA